MAIARYRRFDIHVILRRSEDGGTRAETRVGRLSFEHFFTAEEVTRWSSGGVLTHQELSARLRLPDAVRELLDLYYGTRPADASERFLARLAFDVRDSRWEVIDLEKLWTWAELDFRMSVSAVASVAISAVRVSPVRPRVGLIPFTLPVRVVELDLYPSARGSISTLVAGIFGGLSDWARAMVVGDCEPTRLEDFLKKESWPTAEVLHFTDPGIFRAVAEAGKLLSTAATDIPGTLGWLSRLADSWQTRLVVLEHRSGEDARQLRRLAHALMGRGGPAVVLLPAGHVASREQLYGALIHDLPLDAWMFPHFVRFLGAGREELLRPSSIVTQLTRPSVEAELIRENPRVEQVLRQELSGLPGVLYNLDFEHESGGMLPLSMKLDSLRQQVQSVRPRPPVVFSFSRRADPVFESFPIPESAAPPRQVNLALHAEGEDGGLRELDAASTLLEPEQVVHLSVDIASLRKGIPGIGSMALLEEGLHWTRDQDGQFLDVGVTGMDFDVLGSPVQPLWLPRQEPSDTLFFALAPRRETRVPGVARLRVCLYQRGNLLQSFRLVARVSHPGGDAEQWEARARGLADAIGVDVAEVLRGGETGSLVRLEYSAVEHLQESPDARPRALSFAVNRSAGQDVVTVKGEDLFGVQVGGNLGPVVEALRKTLWDSSKDAQGQYAYFAQGELNRGDPAHFKATLLELARHGWSLFTQLVPDYEAREEVQARLAGEGQVINAAHMSLENVIPWALVYDREFDADRQTPAPVACDAALPGADGSPGASRCGESARCPLHKAHPVKGHTERTVACPRHFWGFRHIVEVPPQQVVRLGETPRPLPPAIPSGDPVTVLTGRYEGLSLATQHFTELSQLLGTTPPLAVLRAAKGRDELLDLLREKQGAPDVVYLYCHAYAKRPPEGKPPQPDEPHLALGAAGAVGWITASQLAGLPPLRHHPLFFLNGCGTAAFDSTRPAQLILSLMAARAGGVIGTEVTIWEGLAGEMARLFLQGFLGKKPAGQALLEARRALLDRYNPLGLVYTLYGSADLKLSPGGTGGSGGVTS